MPSSARRTAEAEPTPEVVVEEEPLAESVPEELEPEPAPEPEPEPTPVHPAAAAEAPFPLAEPGEYYIGLWSGKPNYGCPYCSYATLDGSGQVEIHILSKIDQGNPRHLKALELK